MPTVPDLAERFSAGEARVSHDHYLVLPWVRATELQALWRVARDAGWARANIRLLTDMIACPGGDICALANARSLPIAHAITERYQDMDELHDLGEIDLHISGYINSCGHHHSGHIGILGVDKDGQEWYQITLGGSDGSTLSGAATPGKVVGPSFAAAEVPGVIEALLDTYRVYRTGAGQRSETFIDTLRRVGPDPFRTAANVAALSLQPLAALLQWLALRPWAVVFLPAAPLWAGMLAVAGGALLATRLPWRLRLLAFPLLWPALWWQPVRPAAGQFELLAADIGQGNAVLVRTARHALLYDAGPQYSRESDAGHRVLVPLMRALGLRPDILVINHRDADHARGALSVLQAYPDAAVVSSVAADHTLQSRGPVQRCEAGQRWVWDGVVFEILHPAAGDYQRAARPNALSCVLRVQRPEIPAAPSEIILACLAKHRAQRPSSATDLDRWLMRVRV